MQLVLLVLELGSLLTSNALSFSVKLRWVVIINVFSLGLHIFTFFAINIHFIKTPIRSYQHSSVSTVVSIAERVASSCPTPTTEVTTPTSETTSVEVVTAIELTVETTTIV